MPILDNHWAYHIIREYVEIKSHSNMKILSFLLLLTLSLPLAAAKRPDTHAKQDSLRLVKLEQQQAQQAKELHATKAQLQQLSSSLEQRSDSLQRQIDSLALAHQTLASTSQTLQDSLRKTQTGLQIRGQQLDERSYWGAGISAALVLVLLLSFFLLRRRIRSGSDSIGKLEEVQKQLAEAQEKLQEEAVKLDQKLLELLESQLAQPTATSSTTDHSLLLKLADELARIETNLSKMDPSVRGYKQLVQAKDRMINNVRAYGYEIISLIGQEYNDGMQFAARFVPDTNLEEGKRIITGMTKMQVNYQGKMIQAAEIVVSQNI